MVVVNPPLPPLSPDVLSLFYTTDELLSESPLLLFYGNSATTISSASSSRIQVHVYSPAGFQSFPRLTVSPSSPLYAAVHCLAREEQGDDICRGLAFSLYKYFSELPVNVKELWGKQSSTLGGLPSAPKLFTEAHAAILASRMVKVENVVEVIKDVRRALCEQSMSWLDLDVVLPPGSMKELDSNRPRESTMFEEEEDVAVQRYGEYAPVVKLFGEAAFIPTSKVRRAPSRPTAINRSIVFSRKQKEALRREMCELLDTEESYVGKIYDLLHSVAEDFRQKAKDKAMSSSSPSEQALRGLFPPSLDQILEVNTKFLDALRAVLEETENDAIQDIEATTDGYPSVPKPADASRTDLTGTLTLARCLVAWFPKFTECYSDYIQAHSQFAQFLRIFMKETGSSFSKRVQETGEQRLTSMLIEPIQRLPRYNLYIDNIVKQLPARHPALKPLLKARDIITEICSQDSVATQQSKSLDRLRRLIPTWPQHFRPQGRLITAIDVAELVPPYHPDPQAAASRACIFLLFADCLVLLRRGSPGAISARALLVELDKPASATAETLSANRDGDELIFYQQMSLSDVFITEMDGGRMIQMISPKPPPAPQRKNPCVRVFYLSGTYEGRAARFVEDLVKARVEGRFPEAERESHRWEVRSTMGDLSLFSAVFDDAGGQIQEGRRAPALVRMVVDPTKGMNVAKVGQEGVEVVASLTSTGEGFFRLELEALNEHSTRDHLTATEFLPVLTKRLSNYFQMRNQIRNPALTATLLLRNQQTLKSLKISAEDTEDDSQLEQSYRPASPVKLLSNLFSSGSVKENAAPKKLYRPSPVLGDIPRMMPPPVPRSNSARSEELSREGSVNKSMSSLNLPALASESFGKLDETLAAYVLALHARKGNVVGKSLMGRASADELSVNELYNSLLENPINHEVAAHAPVDVLFASFEKFLKVAWKEKMGAVISHNTLAVIQSKSDSFYPGEFEEYFRLTIGESLPQNQRALQAIIKLLADLLAGTGNDSDRGILTAAFAEVLVPEGNAHDYISLLDRLVEDVDALFARPASSGSATPSQGSLISKSHHRFAADNGSIGSNTSSLRKKFGFGTLHRENSKSEHESKVGSVWRTLSKTGRNADGQPASMSKATLGSIGRSRSIDVDVHLSPKRPVSRDRPTVLGAFASEENLLSGGRPFVQGLGTIGEVPPTPGQPPRKKRRSSLSDLKTLQSSPSTWSPQTPRTARHDSLQRSTRQTSATLRKPSHSKHSSIPGPRALEVTPSPARFGSPSRREGSPSKENAPTSSLPRPQSTVKATPTVQSTDVTITSYSPVKRRTDSMTNIPTLKSAGLSERPTSGNSTKQPPFNGTEKPSLASPLSASPAKKLRMQSPQKLRERLQKEQQALQTTSTTLQAELSKIGQEIGELSTKSSSPSKPPTTTPPASNDIPFLATRLASLETTLPALLTPLTTRLSTLESDISTSLLVSESRAKKLDALYRDAGLENEALYSRFNDELARVLRAVKSGDGVEEMRRRLKEAEEEGERLRKENWRLRREVGGLRAQLRE
ncbi:hypothetical protein W97_00080 [Coniosporium apollinis CBS 100218]|uniref:DH domain-containing protein n=1 Tax=Coniosporium apollinis (strain CBS 100218) TaxID=1168221 RepID=R7YG42_CONA1|nr:uncharacterized protein W97_00080 [Coniosporium apollinis CBS 100218]EON60870.1 hypothetical protein W97_00080 [Coniosporium apollinis CBS 100218]